MASVRSLLAKLQQPSSAVDSDRMLLARFASAGDESAFAALVDRHGPLVLGVCRRTIGDFQLAEDAFQAVFLVLAKKAVGVSVRESLANWLYVVARRVAVKAAKRRRPLSALPESAEAVERPDAAERSELARVLDEELGRLPERLRSPLIACHLQACTQPEAAERLGLSLSTVRRRLDAGRELLRDRLAARGVTLGVLAAATVPPAVAAETVATAIGVRIGAAVGPHLLPLVREGLRMGPQFWKVGVGLLGVAAAVAVGVAVSYGEERPKLQAAPAAKWATIKGRVVWPSDPPAAATVNVTADRGHCLAKGPIASDELVISKNTGGLKNVWVYLRPDDDDPKAELKPEQVHPRLLKPKATEHEVDQPCCQFVPRVLAVRAGDTIKFKNSSPIPHNVKFDSDAQTFNQTLTAGGIHTTQPLAAQRNPAMIACNIHPWMTGSVMAFDHPYFALTDADGNFEIKDAPVGKFRILYRHERGYHTGKAGRLGFSLEVTGPTLELESLTFEAPK